MATVRNLQRFTQVFQVDPSVLRMAGVFDPILNADTRLFVDPLLLERIGQAEMRDAQRTWHRRFTDIIHLLRASRLIGDIAWRSADRLFNFP
jgi:hypothetical protein